MSVVEATAERADWPTLRAATVDDLPAVSRLLTASDLPVVGVADAITTFVVAEHRAELVGVAGLEVCCDNGLLRSVAVTPLWQKRGLARALVSRVIAEAEERRLRAMYLLTTTAAHYSPGSGLRRRLVRRCRLMWRRLTSSRARVRHPPPSWCGR